MSVIVIFDVAPEKLADAVAALKKYGYFKGWKTNPDGKLYDLPVNTMWKPKIATTESYEEVQQIFRNNGIKATNLIVFTYLLWKAQVRS